MMAQKRFQTLVVMAGVAVLGALPISALAQDGSEYSGSYALLIGVGKYDHGFWRPSVLPNVQRYLEDMKKALTNQGFRDDDVEIVPDPTNSELRNSLHKFLTNYGGRDYSRLLIYFMGHGYSSYNSDKEVYTGYLVSRDDVPANSHDNGKFEDEAIPMYVVRDWASKYITRAKHTLFIIDACYSGHAIPPGPLDDSESLLPPDPEYVVQVVTAGSAFQKVLAKSMFTESLLEAITTARTGTDADENLDGFLTGTELGDFLHWKVARASGGHQTPYTSQLFGGGEFVFHVPRDNP